MEGRGDQGGWKPVIYGKSHNAQRIVPARFGAEVVTVFVDNLPVSMNPKGLFNLFSKFGVVKDVFIPSKVRISTRTRFGFVRFDCTVAAKIAIQKADRLWCDDKQIRVKMAEYGKALVEGPNGTAGKMQKGMANGLPKECTREQNHQSFAVGGRISFAEVVRTNTEGLRTVVAHEEGNGWLFGSVIVQLKSHLTFAEFENVIHLRGADDILVRNGGGKCAVLTFKSVAIMKEMLIHLDDIFKEWCDSVKEWNRGVHLTQERSVWITCYGVPLNVWNYNTFRNIGRVWGDVIQIDEATLRMEFFGSGKIHIVTKHMNPINQVVKLDCKGTLYPVRVCEEQVVVSKLIKEACKCLLHIRADDGSSIDQELHGSVNGGQSSEKTGEVAAYVDREVEHSNEVAGNVQQERGGCAEVDGVDGSVTPSVVAETMHSHPGSPNNKMACTVDLTTAVSSGVNVTKAGREVEDEIITPGFIASSNGLEVDRSLINMEVSLGIVHTGGLLCNGPLHQICRSPQGRNEVENQISINKSINKSAQVCESVAVKSSAGVGHQKRSLGSSNVQIGGRKPRSRKKLSKSEVKMVRRLARGAKISKSGGAMLVGSWHRGVLLRAAMKGVSSSLSSGHGNGREKKLLSEAQATIEVGRILGLNCNGSEQEAIQRCMELEKKDEDRVALTRVGAHP